jgi:hypothetical protein
MGGLRHDKLCVLVSGVVRAMPTFSKSEALRYTVLGIGR